jgi:glycosyltransferase involved in cell wall biosynthesis
MQAEGPVRTILFLHRGGDQIRGSEVALLTLLDEIDRHRYEPVVVFSNAILAAPLEARGIRGTLLEMPELLMTRGEVRLPVLGYAKARRDIAALGQRVGAALIVCNGGGPNQLGLSVSKRLSVPLLTYLHHPAPKSYLRNWRIAKTPTVAFASKYTEGHTRSMIGRGGPVVYPGLVYENATKASTPNPELRAAYGVPEGAVTFVQVGALVPHKGHATLIRAFARIAPDVNAYLLIAGAGPEQERLIRLVRDLGLSHRINVAGRISDVQSILEGVADVNVLASSEEGLGLVNIEAAEWGIPSIAANCTGIRETIQHGRTGLLFAPGDDEALAMCMRDLAEDAGRRATLGKAARDFVQTNFGRSKFATEFSLLMEECLSSRRNH